MVCGHPEEEAVAVRTQWDAQTPCIAEQPRSAHRVNMLAHQGNIIHRVVLGLWHDILRDIYVGKKKL